jgi:hypothetical protein
MSADPGDLGRHDRLLWSIGRVSQAHVGLELALRGLWSSLSSLDIGPTAPAEGDKCTFHAVTGKVSAGIRAVPGLPDEVARAAWAVLRRARELNDARNRVVHDHWIDVTRWVGYRGPDGHLWDWWRADPQAGMPHIEPTPSGLSFVDDCLHGLEETHHDVVVLMHLLSHFVPVLKDRPKPLLPVERLLEQLATRAQR